MLYDRIKKICKEKGISIAQVEKEAKLGNGTISKWNDCSTTVENLKAVANVLEVPIEELLAEQVYSTRAKTTGERRVSNGRSISKRAIST